MIDSKKGILVALNIPILILALVVGLKTFRLSTGTEVVLPVVGYDPRDLFSGHFLSYSIDYGIAGLCKETLKEADKKTYVCLSVRKVSDQWIDDCPLIIKGNCSHGRFEAGVERYYVPEDEAKKLEKLVQSKKASVLLSVTKDGDAQVKDLLIDGVSWRKN